MSTLPAQPSSLPEAEVSTHTLTSLSPVNSALDTSKPHPLSPITPPALALVHPALGGASRAQMAAATDPPAEAYAAAATSSSDATTPPSALARTSLAASFPVACPNMKTGAAPPHITSSAQSSSSSLPATAGSALSSPDTSLARASTGDAPPDADIDVLLRLWEDQDAQLEAILLQRSTSPQEESSVAVLQGELLETVKQGRRRFAQISAAWAEAQDAQDWLATRCIEKTVDRLMADWEKENGADAEANVQELEAKLKETEKVLQGTVRGNRGYGRLTALQSSAVLLPRVSRTLGVHRVEAIQCRRTNAPPWGLMPSGGCEGP